MTQSRGERVTTMRTLCRASERIQLARLAASRTQNRPHCAWGRWLAGIGFAACAGITFAQASDVPWVTKSVHGYRIALAVESVLAVTTSKADPRHASELDHRLIVSFTDEKTGAAMNPSSASVNVAELGYKGIEMPLQRVDSGNQVFHEARLRLSTRSPHRILVHATPVHGGRTLEAQFQYRHHH